MGQSQAVLSPGQIIADKYRVDSVIGTGGMGVVLAATHVELDQRVALKLLRDVGDSSIARFKREARLLVKLKSEHVARVFDVGSLDDDTPYIVMELLDGEDLSKVLERRGRLTVEETVDWVLEATEAVAEAHVLGMVHRDLKPANLFLARGPGGAITVKVLDFGVSKMMDPGEVDQTTAGALTNEGVALGSPGYMAPEQMSSSRDVDARADIYSLGAMLYRLVSGRNPYKGNSLVSVLAAMAIDPLPPLKSLVPEAPDGFAEAVERCLAQDANARFPSVAHLAHALAPFGTRKGRDCAEQILATMNVPVEPFGATIVRPILPSAPAVRPSSIPPPPPAPPEPDRSWMTFAAAGLFAGAIVVGFFAWTFGARSKPEVAPVPVPITSATTPATTTTPPPPPLTPTIIGSSPMPVTPETPASNVSTAKPSPKLPATKPKPTAHPHGPSTAPPSPTDVPGGRH